MPLGGNANNTALFFPVTNLPSSLASCLLHSPGCSKHFYYFPSKCSPNLSTPNDPSLCCLCTKNPASHQQREAIKPQVLRPLKQIFLWRRTSLVPKTWARNHSSGLSLFTIQNLSRPLFDLSHLTGVPTSPMWTPI